MGEIDTSLIKKKCPKQYEDTLSSRKRNITPHLKVPHYFERVIFFHRANLELGEKKILTNTASDGKAME